MKIIHFKLFKLAYVSQLKPSRNGNPKWRFVAQSVTGEFLEFQTAADVGSTATCKLHGVAQSTIIKVAYHDAASGKLMADAWGLASQVEIDWWNEEQRAANGRWRPIRGDSFKEWFEANVSDEDCQYFVEEGVECDWFDEYGGLGPIYDRFDQELFELVIEGHRSLDDAIDYYFFGSPGSLQVGIFLRACELLAEERVAGLATE